MAATSEASYYTPILDDCAQTSSDGKEPAGPHRPQHLPMLPEAHRDGEPETQSQP